MRAKQTVHSVQVKFLDKERALPVWLSSTESHSEDLPVSVRVCLWEGGRLTCLKFLRTWQCLKVEGKTNQEAPVKVSGEWCHYKPCPSKNRVLGTGAVIRAGRKETGYIILAPGCLVGFYWILRWPAKLMKNRRNEWNDKQTLPFNLGGRGENIQVMSGLAWEASMVYAIPGPLLS